MDDQETLHRRARLRELIESCFSGSQAALLRHIETRTKKIPNQGELSAILKDDSGKSFGDKKARGLCQQIGLSRRWFELPIGSNLDPAQWQSEQSPAEAKRISPAAPTAFAAEGVGLDLWPRYDSSLPEQKNIVDKYELRRLRLAELRDAKCGGVAAVLAGRIGRDASYVSRMLYPEGKAGKKRIADDMIEVIEKAFDLPRGWFDMPLGTRSSSEGALFGVATGTDGECLDLWQRYNSASAEQKTLVEVALDWKQPSAERRDHIKNMVEAALLVVRAFPPSAATTAKKAAS